MTLCIGAFARLIGEPRIVLCFDHQVGDDYSASNSTFKCDLGIGNQLVAVWSGTLDHVDDALRIYRNRLATKIPTLADFKEDLWMGFQELKDSLSRRGQDQTDVQLIIGGYVEGEPSLFSVSSDGVYSPPSYCTIGSGGYVADAMLRWRKTSRYSQLDEVLYAVYEAKKMSEISPHVGPTTTMLVLLRTERIYVVQGVQDEAMKYLDSCFRKFGPRVYAPKGDSFPFDSII
jgi:20S proteasome alpha/beta subunit